RAASSSPRRSPSSQPATRAKLVSPQARKAPAPAGAFVRMVLAKILGKARLQACSLELRNTRFWEGHDFQTLREKRSGRKPPGMSGILFGLGRARGRAALPGSASVPRKLAFGW